MNSITKTIGRIISRRRSRSRALRRDVDRIRKSLTTGSRAWEGTRIVREARDAR